MTVPQVVIASVLKPVDDPRMYEKFALSLAQTYKYDINIIGFYSKTEPAHSNIHFHPIFNFKRLSLARVFAGWKFLNLLIAMRPKLIIFTSHELILPSVLYKLFYGCKLIYDLRENYFLNIWHGTAFPPALKQLIAVYVRIKELVLSPLISHFISAESVYPHQIGWLRSRCDVIQNKYQGPIHGSNGNRPSNLQLLYSGTIAEESGIFQAIELATTWHQLDENVELKIIGFCPNQKTLRKLQKTITELAFIELVGGDRLVPHQEILKSISTSDFGLVLNRDWPHVKDCIPTKVFEYAAHQLPIIASKGHSWSNTIEENNMGLLVEQESNQYQEIINSAKSATFYPKGSPPEFRWETEEVKLVEVVGAVLNISST